MNKLNITKTKTIFFAVVISAFLVACSTKLSNTEMQKKITETKIQNYIVYSNGITVDKKTGMVWARCSIGQEWDSENSTCTGVAQEYTWKDTFKAVEKLNQQNYLGYNDWKLPHIEDLSRLKYCNTGFGDTKLIPTKRGKEKKVEVLCNVWGDDEKGTLSINERIFPNSKKAYWSSSSNVKDNSKAWLVTFYYGYDTYASKNLKYYIRPIRENN